MGSKMANTDIKHALTSESGPIPEDMRLTMSIHARNLDTCRQVLTCTRDALRESRAEQRAER